MERKTIILITVVLLVLAVIIILVLALPVPAPIMNTGTAVFEPARNIGAPVGF